MIEIVTGVRDCSPFRTERKNFGVKMILGLGTDIVNIERIEKLVKKFGENFYKRILSKSELKKLSEIKNINEIKNKNVFCAKRFCAKEAFAKALGVGLGRGINFADIIINNDIMGKPIIELTDKGAEFVCQLFKKKTLDDLKFSISISDDYPFANAVAMVENREE
jgi:holo-[acyl-carrier protein] synthase